MMIQHRGRRPRSESGIGNAARRATTGVAQATAVNLAVSVLLIGCLAGCGESQPSRFYMLSPTAPAEAAQPSAKSGIALVVGPVEIPKYLDRPQIVTVTVPNGVTLAEYDRWAEPLDVNVTRALAENLAAMTSARRVELYPFPAGQQDSDVRQVVVQILRFHPSSDGVIDLSANWSILDADGRRTLRSGTAEASERATPGDYKSTTLAMSRAIAAFSTQIASAYNDLAGGGTSATASPSQSPR
jgi:uncharacterized lipoprotein YmbA